MHPSDNGSNSKKTGTYTSDGIFIPDRIATPLELSRATTQTAPAPKTVDISSNFTGEENSGYGPNGSVVKRVNPEYEIDPATGKKFYPLPIFKIIPRENKTVIRQINNEWEIEPATGKKFYPLPIFGTFTGEENAITQEGLSSPLTGYTAPAQNPGAQRQNAQPIFTGEENAYTPDAGVAAQASTGWSLPSFSVDPQKTPIATTGEENIYGANPINQLDFTTLPPNQPVRINGAFTGEENAYTQDAGVAAQASTGWSLPSFSVDTGKTPIATTGEENIYGKNPITQLDYTTLPPNQPISINGAFTGEENALKENAYDDFDVSSYEKKSKRVKTPYELSVEPKISQINNEIVELKENREKLIAKAENGLMGNDSILFSNINNQIASLETDLYQIQFGIYKSEQAVIADKLTQEAGLLKNGKLPSGYSSSPPEATADEQKLVNALLDPEATDTLSPTVEGTKPQSYFSDVAYLKDGERGTMTTFISAGRYDKAMEYYNAIEPLLNERAYAAESEEIETMPGAGGAILRAVMPVATNRIAPAAYLQNLTTVVKNALTGDDTPVDINSGPISIMRLGNKAAERTAQDLSDFVYKKTGSQLLSDTAGALTPLGYSMVDAAITLAFGQEMSVYVMGAQAAGQETVSDLERGASPGKALVGGTMSGVIDALVKKLPLSELFEANKSDIDKNTVESILLKSGVAASGATIDQYMRVLQDIAVMGDDSEYMRFKASLMDNGYSEEAATKQANYKFFVGEMLRKTVENILSPDFED